MRKTIFIFAIMLAIVSCQKEPFQKNPKLFAPDLQLAAFAAPQVECGTVKTPLLGGKTINVGNLTVSNDNGNVYVRFETTGDWLLEEVHLYIVDYMPTARLVPGSAPFKSGKFENYQESYEFTLPFGEFGCDDIVWLQAHASVVKVVDGIIVQGETAYGGTITQPQKGSWYGNVVYKICCGYTPPTPVCQTETAWAGNFDPRPLKSNGKPDGNWFFVYNGSGIQTIWAGQHINIGTVQMMDGSLVISLTNGWGLQNVSDPVKIQGYNDSYPVVAPAPGQLTTYKGNELAVQIDAYDFYAIHLDVQNCPPIR